MKLIRDTWLLFAHGVRATLRDPVGVVFGLFQPICYLLLFAPLLEGVADAPGFSEGDAITAFAPGLLVMQGIVGTTSVGFGLIAQVRGGVVERLRVTPVSRLALLLGNALCDVCQLLVQAVLLVGTAWLIGLEADPFGVVLAFALLALTGLLAASCSYALALRLRNESSFGFALNFFLLPVLLLSGILLPLTLAPEWMRTVAEFNPFAHAVSAARSLFAGNVGDPAVLRGFAVLIPLTLLALWWASRSYRRSVS